MNSDYVKLVRGFIGDVVIQSPATTGTTYQAQYIPRATRTTASIPSSAAPLRGVIPPGPVPTSPTPTRT